MQVPYIVNFAFNAKSLDAEAISRLDQQAEWIVDHPFAKIRVYGHTDKIGSDVYNDNLGQRRADQVVAYLVSKGIDEDRLEVVLSYGEAFPLVDTNARERANRRVMTDVSGVIRVPVRDNDDNDPAPRRTVQIVDTVPPTDGETQLQSQEFIEQN